MLNFHAYRWMISTLLAMVLFVASGCGVRSSVIVTSEPEGAVVTMNGVNIGETPLQRPFTWYWYYDFRAEKDGYEPVEQRERFRAPVYLWAGLDLLMEMMPFYVYDTKEVHLVLRELEDRPAPQLAGN
ncbi:MAG: PEGA domain-containing protein [Candidatus Sumerlaeia bacterium]|nr:PEGA domain-containing protein [Candidatus Sumerlaeia bacterium]